MSCNKSKEVCNSLISAVFTSPSAIFCTSAKSAVSSCSVGNNILLLFAANVGCTVVQPIKAVAKSAVKKRDIFISYLYFFIVRLFVLLTNRQALYVIFLLHQ